MIKVSFFGLLRINSGVKTLEVEADTIKELFLKIEQQSGISVKTLQSCTMFINGKEKKLNQKLHDGDQIVFMPPVCGG